MKLSKRLKAICNLVSKESIVLDIGCDHAYLSIDLVKTGKSTKVYAIDNKEMPLNEAKKNIVKHNLESKIIPLLSDGLKDIDIPYYTHIIMAGLGGELIANIIKRDHIYHDATLILEPNNNSYALRETLKDLSYQITYETMVCDSGQFYPIIVAKKAESKPNYTHLELHFGPILLKNKSKELKDYLLKEIKILESKNSLNNPSLTSKINFYKEALDEIK